MLVNSYSVAVIFKMLRVALPLTLFFAFSISSFGASLTEYRERLESARLSTVELFQILEEADTDLELEMIAEIKVAIPVNEKIEWPGGGVETDNKWLAYSLQEFSDEGSLLKRATILTTISERLLSISETVKKLEQAAGTDQTKDRDKQKLGEILRREEFKKPVISEESLFQKWWREFIQWLYSAMPKPSISPNETTGFGSLQVGLQILIYGIVVGLLGFLIYRFAPLLFRGLVRKDKAKRDDRVIFGERIDADSLGADLFDEAENLARQGNLRGAIRKGYIALLCDLGDRNVVRLARHKTNRDYLSDIRKDKVLHQNMSGLTLNFENSWYGLRPVEQIDWEQFRSRYLETIASVRR